MALRQGAGNCLRAAFRGRSRTGAGASRGTPAAGIAAAAGPLP